MIRYLLDDWSYGLPSLQIWVWEEDGAYIAKCLDIPGCISEGDTRE
jgi:hypothetical protein